MRYYPIKCWECGKFCIPTDSGVMYGNTTDSEPPDPLYLCNKCAGKNLNKAIKQPDKIISRCWWIKPAYVRIAKSILRHRKL